MNSKAQFEGHPIHPLLVGIPIVLFIATIAFELAHLETGNATLYHAAMIANIGGVVIALFAVVPSAIGAKHAVLNSLTIALFAISAVLLVRSFGTGELYVHLPLAFGMMGIVALTFAAALGYALPNPLFAARSPRGLAARNFGAALPN